MASGQIIKKFWACGADTLAQQSRETSRANFVEVRLVKTCDFSPFSCSKR